MTSDAGKHVVGALALGLAAFILVLIGTARFGVSCSPDSVAYLSVARHVAMGEGFVRYDGQPFTHWPPLFPLMLGLPGLLGIDPLIAGRFVNGAAFAVITSLSCLILRERIGSQFLLVIGSLAVLFAFPVIRTSVYLMSEPWFMVFVLGGLWRLERYVESGRSSELVTAALLTALACLTRYAGITVILSGCLVLLAQGQVPWKHRFCRVVLFSVIGVAPLAVWLVRNWVESGSFTGSRSPAETGTGEHLWTALNTMSAWLIPPQLPAGIRVVAVCLLLVAVPALYISRVQGSDRKFRPGGAFSTFVPLYLVFMVASAARYEMDHLDHRMLAPVFIPLVIVFMDRLDLLEKFPGGIMALGWFRKAVRWSLAAWMGYLGAASGVTLYYYGWQGGGYSLARWRESEVLAYLDHQAVPDHLYSNRPDAIYLYTGRRARHVPTPTTQVAPVMWRREIESVLGSDHPAWLIWFDDAIRPWDRAGGCVRELVTLEPVSRGQDGVVFRIFSPIAEEDMGERGACSGISRRMGLTSPRPSAGR